jgi:hypothetical protein
MKAEKNKGRLRAALIAAMLLLAAGPASYAQVYSVKADVLGWATGTINGEASMALNENWSLHLPLRYNPWNISEKFKMKNLTALPGVRYWPLQTYAPGYFFGVNGIVSRYNFAGLLAGNHRYDGMAYGLGLSAGYSIPINLHWNIEIEAGAGAVWSRRDKYPCERCGQKIEEQSGVWAAPDKLSVSFVYYF